MYVSSIDFKKSLMTLSDEPDLMTTPAEDDLSDTKAFHGLSSSCVPSNLDLTMRRTHLIYLIPFQATQNPSLRILY